MLVETGVREQAAEAVKERAVQVQYIIKYVG
jgi:hypothetical protein